MTVILAAVLFMLGVAGVIRVFTFRLGFLAIGTLLPRRAVQIARIGLG